MAFQVTDQHIQEYHCYGYTVFRQILPPSLIADLRRATDQGRELVRALRDDAQVQRFQPVADFDIDQKPFEDYANLPELHEALARLLSPRHTYGNVKELGVLIEPGAHPRCTQWHRDARDLIVDEEEWNSLTKILNQVNCPLWEDSCTWFVPGSHLRGDLEGEHKAVESFPPSKSAELTLEERERLCLEYCQRMPGGIQLHLNAGDFALYRPFAWHLGNYVPYKKRATLHEGVWLPEEGERWRKRIKELNTLNQEKKAALAAPALP